MREENIKDKPEFKDLPFVKQVKIVDDKMKALGKQGKDFYAAIEELSDEEKIVIYKYKELIQAEETEKARLVEEKKQSAETKKKEVEKEYKEVKAKKPELVLDANIKGKQYSAGALKNMMASRKLDKIKKKAFRKGGEIIIKGHIGKGYELIWSKTPKRYVEFLSKNEQGEEVRNITRITKTKGHLRGSSIPVHLCLEGVANSIDPFEGIETNMSAEYFNKLLQGEFQSGLATGLAIRPEKASRFDMAKVTPILFLALLGGMIILGYYVTQIYEVVSKLGGV